MNGYMSYESQSKRTSAERLVGRIDRFLECLYAILGALAGWMCCPQTRKIFRGVVVTVCFFGFVGLCGGIECGAIAAPLGVVMALMLVFIEILCLR